jgi:hypothetical protein
MRASRAIEIAANMPTDGALEGMIDPRARVRALILALIAVLRPRRDPEIARDWRTPLPRVDRPQGP